jgi:hypothetical protein
MGLLQVAILSLTAWQGMVVLGEEQERRAKYNQAANAAVAAGKPLLVIGGPYGTSGVRAAFSLAAHGCGDICLDIDARACQSCPSQMVADIRRIPYDDGYFGAAIASHVLEHLETIDDAVRALDEMHRVADRVWIASPGKSSVIAWLHPGHKLWVEETAHGIIIEQRRTYGSLEPRQAVSI